MVEARKIKLHPLSLTFLDQSDEFETKFRRHHFQTSLTRIRITQLLGLLFYLSVIFLDPSLLPITASLSCILTLLIFPLILLSIYGLTFSRFFPSLYQPLEGLFLMVAASMLIIKVTGARPAIEPYYFTGLLILIMAGYSIIQLRFSWAASCIFIISTAYLTAIIQSADITGVKLLTRFFLIAVVNIIGMISCYCIEYLQRQSFAWQESLTHKQNQLQSTNLKLENQVKERTEQLLKANRELTHQLASQSQQQNGQSMDQRLMSSQRLEAVAILAGGIAHDFNNILAAILGFSDLGLLKTKDHELRDHLHNIRAASLRGRDLVSQLAAFRPQSKHNRYPLEIRHLIKEAMKFLRASLPPTIELELHLDQGLNKILADPINVHQAFMNICINGVEAMPAGKGVLRVSLSEEDLAPEDKRPAGRYQHLSISDNGRGMTEDERLHIFDPYFTSKEPGHGNGMGLPITREIMEHHQGSITVESDRGQGSTFHLFFPVLAPEEKEKTEPLTNLVKARNHEHILLVDDEESLVKMGVKMLTFLDYQVTGCTEATKALEMIIDKPDEFDLVITDMAMPAMSGSELTSRIMERCPEMPIILLTGFIKDWDKHKAMDHGFKAFLAKPLALQKMAATVHAVLEQWRRTEP